MEAPVFVLWENQWRPAASCYIHPATKFMYCEAMEHSEFHFMDILQTNGERNMYKPGLKCRLDVSIVP